MFEKIREAVEGLRKRFNQIRTAYHERASLLHDETISVIGSMHNVLVEFETEIRNAIKLLDTEVVDLKQQLEDAFSAVQARVARLEAALTDPKAAAEIVKEIVDRTAAAATLGAETVAAAPAVAADAADKAKDEAPHQQTQG